MDVGLLKRVVATLATRVPLELLQHQIDDKQKALVDVLAKCSQFWLEAGHQRRRQNPYERFGDHEWHLKLPRKQNESRLFNKRIQ